MRDHRFELPTVVQQGLHFMFDVAHDIGGQRLEPGDPDQRFRLQGIREPAQHVGGARRGQMRDDDGRRLGMFALEHLGQVRGFNMVQEAERASPLSAFAGTGTGVAVRDTPACSFSASDGSSSTAGRMRRPAACLVSRRSRA